MIAQFTPGQGFKFYTRAFNEIPEYNLTYIKHSLEQKIEQNPDLATVSFFIDGELISDKRTSVSGDLNRMLHGTYIGSSLKHHFHAFDLVLDDIILNSSNECADKREWIERDYMLNSFMNSDPSQVVHYVQAGRADSFDQIMNVFSEMLAKGEEGLILKNIHGKYEYKRSDNWVKLKNIKTADLECIAVLPGEARSKYENTMGAIVCATRDGLLEVNVGSGFTDQQRYEIWNAREKFIGTIVEVKYNEIISTANSTKESLFLPRFSTIRSDKTEANQLIDLQ